MSPGDPTLAPEDIGVPGAAVIPEHELLRRIASGAYGQVWLARNKLGALRAVKIVHRASFDHDRPFEREFAGIKAFEPISRSHEGFVDLLQVGRDDEAGYFYYVMELADDAGEDRNAECRSPKEIPNPNTETAAGQPIGDSVFGIHSDFGLRNSDLYTPRTLASELKRRARLPLEECIQIGLSLAEALAHLHSQGLVHRDIKPSNIIFVGRVPKLADVGLVAGVGETRSFVGTEGFIPPEGPGTPQADLYSLGIVLYVLSTGKSHQDFPEPPAEISTQENHAQRLEFDAVIHKACQARVRDRYQSAEEMLAELALLKRGQSVKAERASRRRWRFVKKVALVTAALALLLTPVAFFKQSRYGHTPKPEAVRLYELGRWHYNQLTLDDHAKALDYLSRAIQADPSFLEPYGELTGVYTWSMLTGLCGQQEREQRIKEIADKVLAIDPNRAEGHLALSLCKFFGRDWRGAESEIVRASQLNPNLAIPHQFYSSYLLWEGRNAEAHRESRRAEELSSPDAVRVSAIVAAWPFMGERRFDLAIAQLQRVTKQDRNFAYGHNYLGECYDAQSNYRAAIQEFHTAAILLGQDDARISASYNALSQAYDAQGEIGYLRKWVELVLADRELPEDQQLFSDTDLAGYYARLGENTKALDEIEKNFDNAPQWAKLNWEPLYDTLHDEPRFKDMLRRGGLHP